ncbi:MAG: TauD/TfdA family dioxygenase [Novosphingobium sp.]|jgi:taurine dioxygenase|nr:TauD/TfdA family dioxygenase [Novosphingobium sp.]
MHSIEVLPLRDDLPFGARIRGVTRDALADEAVRRRINEVFEARGMIVFEDIEQTAKMQVELSNVFGPLKDHPVKMVERLDQDTMPGVITIRTSPDSAICEIDGKPLITWQPWHFDHTYNNELNRAGVLRAETVAPEGGMTAFADGIQIYRDMDPAMRAKMEDMELLYTLDMHYERQFFGLPGTFREIQPKDDAILEVARTFPRAIHPAVWTRATGEKVAHMCAYGCRGIVGNETPEGNALLAGVYDAMEAAIVPYFHAWQPTDMLVWDNWRMLHQACGCDPKYERIMHRTTIKGDYGLGRWETEPGALEAV